MHAQDDLNLPILGMLQGTFSHPTIEYIDKQKALD